MAKASTKRLPEGLPAYVTQLVESESDRGVILILGAYLEELTGDIIRAACISDAQADQILEFRQPAGDFSSKISLCIALGFIDESEAKALNTVRKIRNSAAHFDKGGKGFDVLFDSDQTIDHVINLAKVLGLDRPSPTKESVRKAFIVASRLVATRIIYRAIQIKTPEPPPKFKGVLDAAKSILQGTPAVERLADIERFLRENKFESSSARMKALSEYVASKLEERNKKK